MKNEAIKTINNNLNNLKKITIKDNHDEIWILNQLIIKYNLILNLHAEIDVDIEIFCRIVKETQEEANYFIIKYSKEKI